MSLIQMTVESWRIKDQLDVTCYFISGFSLQHGYHSNPTTPNLQHTSNQEKYDQCGNSTE